MTYDQYQRELRVKRLESREVDNRGTVVYPEVWVTQRELSIRQRAAVKRTMRNMEGQ